VTLNGFGVTGPVLIFHDEILVDDTPPFSVGDLKAAYFHIVDECKAKIDIDMVLTSEKQTGK